MKSDDVEKIINNIKPFTNNTYESITYRNGQSFYKIFKKHFWYTKEFQSNKIEKCNFFNREFKNVNSIVTDFELIFDETNNLYGLKMPYINDSKNLSDLMDINDKEEFIELYKKSSVILKILHDHKCVKGDAEPQNFIYDSKYNVYLIDMDSSGTKEYKCDWNSTVTNEFLTITNRKADDKLMVEADENYDRLTQLLFLLKVIFDIESFDNFDKILDDINNGFKFEEYSFLYKIANLLNLLFSSDVEMPYVPYLYEFID